MTFVFCTVAGRATDVHVTDTVDSPPPVRRTRGVTRGGTTVKTKSHKIGSQSDTGEFVCAYQSLLS